MASMKLSHSKLATNRPVAVVSGSSVCCADSLSRRRSHVVARVAWDEAAPSLESHQQQDDDPYREKKQQPQRKLRQHPDPDYIKEVLAAFPEEGVANVEQALVRATGPCDAIMVGSEHPSLECDEQVLYLEGGYKFLDVRSDRERDLGSIKGSIHVPFSQDKKSWSGTEVQITKTQVKPEDWLAAVNRKVRDKKTKLILHDMNGDVAIDCLELMFENGYENIVGLNGGFKPWFKTFDFNLRRRNFGEYQENYNSTDQLGSGDSCGIHSSGAGFENQDRLSGDFWDNF